MSGMLYKRQILISTKPPCNKQSLLENELSLVHGCEPTYSLTHHAETAAVINSRYHKGEDSSPPSN